ncbi:MAG: DUF4097 family beta strand repeat-containing protein [Candidatus Cloacimonetes bacterium]|nr:DUF4097 family beta strand repeat-containing protein [Candidatus Cloacimonadota bacterium]
MSKMKLQQILAYEGITKIKIENNLAPLTVEASPHGKVELIGELDLQQPFEEFSWEDCLNTSFKNGVLSIVLDEVDGMESRFFSNNQSFIKILVPAEPELKVEMENLPVSFSGIANALVVSSENAPIRIQDCNGNKRLENENGPVSIKQCEGDLHVEMENGPLSAEAISGDTLYIESENGAIKIREACFPKVDITSENGVIGYETLFVEDASIDITTENGVIHFVLPEDMDYELRAQTEQGKIKSRLEQPFTQEDDVYILKNGEGRTKINIHTENGLIKIGEADSINIEFLKAKIELLKDSLAKVSTAEEMEKAKQHFANVSSYISARIANIKEENVKETIDANLAKVKALIDNFDFQSAKDKTLGEINEYTAKINEELQKAQEELRKNFEKIGTKFQETFQSAKQNHGFKIDGLGDYINKVINSSLIKPYLGGEMKNKEKEEVADRSRLKILDMLEAGKITAEEAERLLKAIGQE